MQNITPRCKHLYRLRDRLVEEIRALKETLRETELESFENPIETVNILKNLQEVLQVVNAELEKCPPEE